LKLYLNYPYPYLHDNSVCSHHRGCLVPWHRARHAHCGVRTLDSSADTRFPTCSSRRTLMAGLLPHFSTDSSNPLAKLLQGEGDWFRGEIATGHIRFTDYSRLVFARYTYCDSRHTIAHPMTHGLQGQRTSEVCC